MGNATIRNLITRCAVVALVLFLGCAGALADVTYQYTFSGAGYTGIAGDSANLSGTFVWDATTNSVISSNIDLSGLDATGSDSGSVSCTNCSTGIYDSGGAHYFAVNLGPQALYITFGNSLSLGANDPLALSAYGGANQAEYQGGLPFTGVTGSAVTPEPAGLVLFGSGLLGIGGMLRRKPRK